MPQSTQRPPKSRLRLENLFAQSMPLNARNERPIEPALVLDARIPVTFWRTGWFLRQIEDLCWLELTRETRTFPQTLRREHRGHPGYVIEEIGNFAVRLCPCSTKGLRGPFIPRGVRLQVTGLETDVRSYVVVACSSVIPREGDIFGETPQFLGIFPPDQLHYEEQA